MTERDSEADSDRERESVLHSLSFAGRSCAPGWRGATRRGRRAGASRGTRPSPRCRAPPPRAPPSAPGTPPPPAPPSRTPPASRAGGRGRGRGGRRRGGRRPCRRAAGRRPRARRGRRRRRGARGATRATRRPPPAPASPPRRTPGSAPAAPAAPSTVSRRTHAHTHARTHAHAHAHARTHTHKAERPIITRVIDTIHKTGYNPHCRLQPMRLIVPPGPAPTGARRRLRARLLPRRRPAGPCLARLEARHVAATRWPPPRTKSSGS